MQLTGASLTQRTLPESNQVKKLFLERDPTPTP